MPTSDDAQEDVVVVGTFDTEMVEWWVNVCLCDEHWYQVRPDRSPVRVIPGTMSECIKCEEPANIWVRAKLSVPR